MYYKITAAILALTTFVLGLAVLLNYAKFERAFNGLTESRLAFLARDLRGALEFGLDLGLDPEAMANTADILAREAARDPRILALLVFDEQGRILYQHRRDDPDQPIAELSGARLATLLRDASTPIWSVSDPQTLIVGASLTNNFGRTVGGVVLRYNRALQDRELEQVLFGLIRMALLILLAAGSIALIGVWLLFRTTRHEVDRVHGALVQFLDRPGAPDFQPEHSSTLETLYAAAERRSRELWGRLGRAQRILRLERRLAKPPEPP